MRRSPAGSASAGWCAIRCDKLDFAFRDLDEQSVKNIARPVRVYAWRPEGRMHQPIPEQGKWLRQVVAGHFAYYAVPTNSRALSAFRHYVTDLWRRTLRRRSQKGGFTWERMTKLVADWLPPPRILHPWPDERFDVRHPR